MTCSALFYTESKKIFCNLPIHPFPITCQPQISIILSLRFAFLRMSYSQNWPFQIGLFLFFLFKAWSKYIFQAILELSMQLWLALNSKQSCLSLPGTTGMCYHAWLRLAFSFSNMHLRFFHDFSWCLVFSLSLSSLGGTRDYLHTLP